MRGQLSLFTSEDETSEVELPGRARDRELSRAIPSGVHFGTSSWTFPGWCGLVYRGKPSERDLVARGLEEYARHPLFGTVGIDSSYYRPLAETTLARYAEQLPAGFPCVMKAWSELTTLTLRGSSDANPRFLDADSCERDVLKSLEFLGDHVGPLVFEFAPMHVKSRPGAASFAMLLDRFLGRLSREFKYAVELRNRYLFTPAYLEVLHKHGVAHVLNFWEQMPTIGEQLRADGVLAADHTVCRLLIPPKQRYAARKLELAPFDQLRDPQPVMRRDVLDLMGLAVAQKKALFVVVNNKAEGCSPLTIRAIVEEWAAREPSSLHPRATDV